jgi:hypothetical protein
MTSPTLIDGASRTVAKKWISKARHYASGTVSVEPYSDEEVMEKTQSDSGRKVRSMVANDEDFNESQRQTNKKIRDDDNTSGILYRHDYNKGTKKVPGSGSKDTVLAKLTPGEAVLNKGAAKNMGRDTIAKANAKGRARKNFYED